MTYLKEFYNPIFEAFLGLFLLPDTVIIKNTEATLSIFNRGHLNRELVT